MIYLLPGMGADRRMYAGQWRALPDAEFLDWPSYLGESTLRQVAERIIAEHDITPGDIVGGSSLGGVVALEISHVLNSIQVILIGSAVSPGEINPLLRLPAPLAAVTPWRLVQRLARRHPSVAAAMFADADPKFLRAMCLALRRWRGAKVPPDRVVRIHGAKDHVIRCPADCHVLPRAGHVIAMTHPEECISIIRREVAGQAPNRTPR